MAKSFAILCFALISLVPWASASIRCYTCVSVSSDMTCVDDPDSVPVGSPITDCQHADCCTIFRQEYLESKGEVISFSRSCQPNCPKDGFTETTDASFRIYQTYCSTPLCNTGPGNSKSGGGGSGGDGGSIDVKGKDSSVANMASVALSLGLPLLILVRLLRAQ